MSLRLTEDPRAHRPVSDMRIHIQAGAVSLAPGIGIGGRGQPQQSRLHPLVAVVPEPGDGPPPGGGRHRRAGHPQRDPELPAAQGAGCGWDRGADYRGVAGRRRRAPAAGGGLGHGRRRRIAPEHSNAVSGNPPDDCHVLYFGFDKDVPTAPVPNRPERTDRDAHEEKLLEIAERVVHSWETSQPVNSLLVLGHASPEGTDVYNYDLAMRRAENVSEALAEQVEELERGGGSRIDLQVESRGEKPIVGLSVEEQRQVEVCFRQPPDWFETGPSADADAAGVAGYGRALLHRRGDNVRAEMVQDIKTAKFLTTTSTCWAGGCKTTSS